MANWMTEPENRPEIKCLWLKYKKQLVKGKTRKNTRKIEAILLSIFGAKCFLTYHNQRKESSSPHKNIINFYQTLESLDRHNNMFFVLF